MKISIIGNIASGKTTLAKILEKSYKIKTTHIDSIQYNIDLSIKPYQETIQVLNRIQNTEDWIIDGYGPLDILEERFRLSDQIVFIDFPIWKNYFWLLKRQIKSVFFPREELPAGSSELSWAHTKKLFKTIKQINDKMLPELRRILNRENYLKKLIHIRTVDELKVYQEQAFFP